MKDRWIALYVENQVGVLAKISGLFAGKSYNMKSLTVGTTENEDTSRMTICAVCDDITFEQIKKQLNRMVEVIKVMDLTNVPIHMKEILYAKIKKCSEDDLIIDCIVENNFRYLACIDLYLPNSKVILQPTCHSELFIYAEDYNKILPVLKEVTDNSELVLSKNAFDWK